MPDDHRAVMESLNESERIGYLKGVVITCLVVHGRTGDLRLIVKAGLSMRDIMGSFLPDGEE